MADNPDQSVEGWQPVSESWKPVDQPQVPPAFVDRVSRGLAMSSALNGLAKGVEGFKEGFGTEPLGWSPEHVEQFKEHGIYRDPATGRAGPVRLLNESVMQPAGVLGDLAMRTVSGLASGAASIFGQLIEDAHGYLGNAEQARNEAQNAINYALLRGDQQFSRVEDTKLGPRDQPVGTLPRQDDFKTAANVISGGPPPDNTTEANLRALWQESGIHPAEAAHDASNDGFLKSQLTSKPYNIPDPGHIAPPTNSNAAVGTPRSALAHTGDPYVDRILQSDVTRDAIDAPIVDRTHDVPYTAGGSVPLEDPTFFIDRHFPQSFTIDGVTFDPADPFTIHENAEQHTMDILHKGGMSDDAAYRFAHFEVAEKAEGAWYRAHGIDQDKAEAAYAPYMAQIQREPGTDFPPNLYKRPYPHDEPSAAAYEAIAEPKPSKDEIKQAHEILDAHFADLKESPVRSMGAEASAAMPPLEQQPLHRPGALMAAVHTAGERLMDMGRDLQMKVAPMATGSRDSMSTAKDFASSLRRNRWEWARTDDDLVKRFTPERRKVMWEAADQESVARQLGQRPKQGLITLPWRERVAVEALQARAQAAWMRARDLGMVEGEGLPAYTPRMMINAANAIEKDGAIGPNRLPDRIGQNLFTTTGTLKHRKYMTAEETEAAMKAKYGDQAELARDIRALPMATAKLEDAIAGRQLINAIRDIGRRTGVDTVAEGFKPVDSKSKWFTVDHPAFKTMRKETKSIEIPGQGTTVTATHEMTVDPSIQAGLERVGRALGTEIKQPLRQQDPFLTRTGAFGYTSRQGDVVSTFGNAQTVLEHELGHKIDYYYGLSDKIYRESPGAWRELGELALHRVDSSRRALYRGGPDDLSRHRPYSGSTADYGAYLLSAEERIANMLHAYWHAPQLFQRIAPNAYRWFDNFLKQSPDALKDAIKSVEPSLQVEGKKLPEQTSVMTEPVSISVDQWKQVPIYVRGDFEGPLRSVMSEKNGELYSAAMALKGASTSLIMYSPVIHNAVEFGRAFPTMPGKVGTLRVYFEGNRAKNDVGTMTEAINSGMVPIGHRYFNQDISSIMEEPNLTPGRSLTAKIAGAIPGMFDPAAGAAVKTAIDKAGNFWHNTLLWDRVGDLQMGLYVNYRDDMRALGIDPQTSARVAAHLANRYAGALPVEAMSNNARKISNMLMFSRSFTLGNLGVFKDAITGLPKDVMAQIERDMGEVDPKAAGYAKAVARRKAAAVIGMDIMLFYVTNSMLQSAINVMRGDSNLDEEEHGYVTRLSAQLQRLEEHPLEAVTPMSLAGGGIGAAIGGPIGAVAGTALGTGLSQLKYLSSTYSNEPGRQDRVKVGYAKDGTAIYARNPFGKIGEEFVNYTTTPLDMLLKKQSTLARPLWQIINNDAGFGRKLYDPDPDTSPKMLHNMLLAAEHFAAANLPVQAIGGAADLVKGEGDKAVNELQLAGPLAGLTFSKGAPGGPAVGEMYHAKDQYQYRIDAALPDIRRQILRGDTQGALDRMRELGVPPGLQKYYLRTTMTPATRLSGKALRDFYTYATPEQKARFEASH